MRRFQLLLFLSSCLLAVLSCKSFAPENASIISTDKKIVENKYFNSLETDYLYKAQITVYGNDISGIVVIKKISNETHRVVMTTDFGNKMMDFEISANDFKINYIIPDLDRSMVKKILEKDFRILLNPKFQVKQAYENSYFNIYSSSDPDKTYFLYYSKSTGILEKIVVTENSKEKINFSFEGKNPIFADEIKLKHNDFKIQINLHQIIEN